MYYIQPSKSIINCQYPQVTTMKYETIFKIPTYYLVVPICNDLIFNGIQQYTTIGYILIHVKIKIIDDKFLMITEN